MGLGSDAVGDIGTHRATLSPGGRACGDSWIGTVRLTGTGTTGVTWYIQAMDQDYAFAGTVFTTSGRSVDTVFAAPAELTDLEMCVCNSSQRTVTASYELSPA